MFKKIFSVILFATFIFVVNQNNFASAEEILIYTYDEEIPENHYLKTLTYEYYIEPENIFWEKDKNGADFCNVKVKMISFEKSNKVLFDKQIIDFVYKIKSEFSNPYKYSSWSVSFKNENFYLLDNPKTGKNKRFNKILDFCRQYK